MLQCPTQRLLFSLRPHPTMARPLSFTAAVPLSACHCQPDSESRWLPWRQRLGSDLMVTAHDAHAIPIGPGPEGRGGTNLGLVKIKLKLSKLVRSECHSRWEFKLVLICH